MQYERWTHQARPRPSVLLELLLLLRWSTRVVSAGPANTSGIAAGFPADALLQLGSCCGVGKFAYSPTCVNNNLGGRGPDRYKAPAHPNAETLRFKGVPAASGRFGAVRGIDLVVSATTAYTTRSPYKNGLHGKLFQVNVDAGNTVDLQLQLRDGTTDQRVRAQELVLLVLDLDEDIGRMSRTAVSSHGYADSFLSETTALKEVVLKNNESWFLSQQSTGVADTPASCCDSLSRSQLDKIVAFRFEDVSTMSLKVHVSYGRKSHNFLLGLQLCTSCLGDMPKVLPKLHMQSKRTKVHMDTNRVETILWSIGDMLHLPHHGDKDAPQPTAGPAPTALPTPSPTAGPAAPTPQPQQDHSEAPVAVPTPPPQSTALEQLPEGQPETLPPAPPPPTMPPPPPPAPQPHYETGGFPPSAPEGHPWPVAGNRVCHGSEVMWAWCKGECIGTCGGCTCAGGGCSAQFEGDKRVPLDCALSAWSEWTTCSSSCGIGWHNRMRHVVQPPEYGGIACQGSLWQMSSCQNVPCSDRSFMLGQWSQWEGCDIHSPGYRFRKRDVREVHGQGNVPATQLPSGTTKQMDMCPNVRENNCVLSQWSEWETCNKPCDGGQTYRRRSLEMLPSHGGQCPPKTLQEAMPCNTMACPDYTNCQMEEWSPWSACTRDCPGSHERTRAIIRNSEQCAAPLKEVSPCHRPDCISIDCKWADWSDWGACTCDCGGGSKRRNRQLAAAPKNGGKLCDAKDKSEVRACNTQPCHTCVDGTWAPWTHWTPCTGCGTSVRTRHRDIAQQANYCGKPAVGSAQQFILCHGGMGGNCGDRDCVVGEWSSWSACSCSCFGIRERTRTIAQFQKGNGKACEDLPLKSIEPCNPSQHESPLPGCGSSTPAIDCKVSPWSSWGQCSSSCGGGNRERSRAILTPATHNGKPCGRESLEEMEQCSLEQCLNDDCVDCQWGEWSNWGSCTKCGGERYRQRSITQLPNYCGKRCDPRAAREVSSCTSNCGTVRYCSWRDWNGWSSCSRSCGIATKSRQRSLGLDAGKPVQYFLELKDGDFHKCHGTQTVTEQCLPFVGCPEDCTPIDCEFSPWTDWVDGFGCVGLCQRRRSIQTINSECGLPCTGSLEETKPCTPTHCHQLDCKFSPWSDWTCIGTDGNCNGRSKHRHRVVQQEPQGGGAACNGVLEETRSCGAFAEPDALHCTLDDWSSWSICTATCGSGWHTRFRSIRTLAMNGGKLCEDALEQGEQCGANPCPNDAEGCTLSSWSEWRGCMDYGQQFRDRQLNPATGTRHPCNSKPGNLLPLHETRPCDGTGSFVVDCTVSAWTEWYTCDKTCGGGEQQRDRQVEAYPLNGGHSCPSDLREIRGCNTQPCEAASPGGTCKDGTWEEWSPWSQCSTTCGGGVSWRTRLRAEMATPCGKPATGVSRETKYCVNDRPCTPDIDCQLSEWSEWSGCSKVCDGLKSRHRSIKTHGEGHGAWCRGATKETTACRPCAAALPIDCLLGNWGSWSECPVTCGTSQMRRERLVKREAQRGGRACSGSLVDIRNCGLEKCPSPPPIDCLWGQWGPWGACSQPGGQRARFRRILRQAKYGGQPCAIGAVEQTIGCKRPHYESFCMWAQWEAWSPCTDWTPCRTWGKRSRVRHLVLSEAPSNMPAPQNGAMAAYSTYYEQRAGNASAASPGPEKSSSWFSAPGGRFEVLLAFACGYFGHIATAAGRRAMSRRSVEGLTAAGVIRSARSWFGGARSAAAYQGYLPVAQDA